MNLLTVDLGNSRCKLRLWTLNDPAARQRTAGVDLESSPGLGARARTWLAELPLPDAGCLCSVAGEELELELLAALGPRIAGPLDARPLPGLSIACREPERVGRDRLFAARGALERAGGGAIVVDAGTALTVDAVRGDRTFLGGAIAPGPELLARSLAHGTARLPPVEPRPGAAALGRDTREALLGGIAVGFRGAARELAARVAAESGLVDAPVVLTGGARAFLLDPPVFGAATVLVEEDLVHLGLAAAARGSPVAGRRTP